MSVPCIKPWLKGIATLKITQMNVLYEKYFTCHMTCHMTNATWHLTGDVTWQNTNKKLEMDKGHFTTMEWYVLTQEGGTNRAAIFNYVVYMKYSFIPMFILTLSLFLEPPSPPYLSALADSDLLWGAIWKWDLPLDQTENAYCCLHGQGSSHSQLTWSDHVFQ